jgi:hypothetical protein
MSKKTLNFENLINLGAETLADLLLEISTGNAAIKRRIRLELTHALGPKELGQEVRKRLATIKRAKGFVDWDKRKAFIADLQTQLDMITDKIAQGDPALAFELLWQFMGLAPSVYERVDDSYGDVGDVFRYAITCFENIGQHVQPDPDTLAERVFIALAKNGYGEYDDLIPHIAPALGPAGLKALRNIAQEYNGKDKGYVIQHCLQQVADQLGDVEAYMAQYSAQDLLNPHWAASVASRLLQIGRTNEAFEILIAARDEGGFRFIPAEWDEAYTTALETLGKSQELLTFRWQRFEESLSIPHLRDLLKSLPDFENVEAETRAKKYALQHNDFHAALDFFLEWPDLYMASDLILAHPTKLDGNRYYSLTPAADTLQGRFNLAAILMRRAMIIYTLDKAKSTRYKHAVRHFLECAAADTEISDYGNIASHEDFVRRLRVAHPRKSGFWTGVDQE